MAKFGRFEIDLGRSNTEVTDLFGFMLANQATKVHFDFQINTY